MKNRILYGSIVLLFITNGFQIYWQLTHVPRHPPSPREEIIEILGFSENQITAYDKLIAKHRQDIRLIEEELIALKEPLYEKAFVAEEVLLEMDFQEIRMAYEQIERINIAHFLAIKQLCSKEQIVKFENLSTRLAKMFTHKPPPRRGHKTLQH
jgi:hypothetical protein